MAESSLESLGPDQTPSQPYVVRRGPDDSEQRPAPITYKGKPLILTGSDAEREFDAMRRQASKQGVSVADLPPKAQLYQEVKKRVVTGQVTGGTSLSNVFEAFFSPFRIRPSIETPTKRQDLNQWYRQYAKYDPLVGAAIAFHAEFPLSDFEIEHQDPQVKEFFNEQKERLGLHQFLILMAQEYYTVGECFPFGFLDDVKSPSMWTRFILLDPDMVRINTHPLVQSDRPYTISIVPNRDLIRIVSNGPNDPVTGKLYQSLPSDFIDAARTGKEIKLPDIQVSHFKRTVNYFSTRGESIISRVIYWLMYRDKLLDGQWAVVDRHISPKEFYFIGEPGDPADSAELAAFAAALQQQWTSPNQAIIWHHAVKVQWEGAEGRILKLGPELDFIERQILIGLGISKALILGEGPGYSAASVAYNALISRYLTFRQTLEKWLLKAVFEPLCHIHQIYKPVPAHLVSRFRIRGVRQPDLPRIIWHKGELHNDVARADFLLRLRDKKLVSGDTILRHMNIDPEIESRNMVSEAVREKLRQKQIADAVGGAVATPSVVTPGAAEPGQGALPSLPEVLPALGGPGTTGGEAVAEAPAITPGPGRPVEEEVPIEEVPEAGTTERPPETGPAGPGV